MKLDGTTVLLLGVGAFGLYLVTRPPPAPPPMPEPTSSGSTKRTVGESIGEIISGVGHFVSSF